MRKIMIFMGVLAYGFLGCGQQEQTVPSEQDDLVPSMDKTDTGYLSDLALELEGVFASEMELDLSDMTDTDRANFIANLSANQYVLSSTIEDHIKFGKNKLDTEKLHMNLSASDVSEKSITPLGNGVKIGYSIRIETIVTTEALQQAGIDPNSLTNKTFNVKLPKDPRNLFERAAETCAEGFDPGTLATYNYFYYFNPDKAGCNVPLADASFTLNSLLPRKTTYPEYDKLTKDKKVTVAIFFGAAEHNEQVSPTDEGVREHQEFVSFIKGRGFQKTQDLNPGERYFRKKAGLDEIINVRSPYDLHALQNDSNGLFKQAMLENEIIIYDGHSFYGSLTVMEDPEAYPKDTYQIFFINSCWSYEYYTKQVFANKASANDANGWALADVVNNTEPAWFANFAEESRVLLTNIFAGCETGGRDLFRQYTWDGIVSAMNKFALDRYKAWGLKSHEVYGVSGVRSNCYDPAHPEACNGQDNNNNNNGETISFDNSAAQDIPDNAPGVRSNINVSDDFTVKSVMVQVNIDHTYVGDLVVELEHNGKTVTLQSRQGGSAKSLVKSFSPIGFKDLGALGDWNLLVTDQASGDSGKLNRWTLTLGK